MNILFTTRQQNVLARIDLFRDFLRQKKHRATQLWGLRSSLPLFSNKRFAHFPPSAFTSEIKRQMCNFRTGGLYLPFDLKKDVHVRNRGTLRRRRRGTDLSPLYSSHCVKLHSALCPPCLQLSHQQVRWKAKFMYMYHWLCVKAFLQLFAVMQYYKALLIYRSNINLGNIIPITYFSPKLSFFYFIFWFCFVFLFFLWIHQHHKKFQCPS